VAAGDTPTYSTASTDRHITKIKYRHVGSRLFQPIVYPTFTCVVCTFLLVPLKSAIDRTVSGSAVGRACCWLATGLWCIRVCSL